ncbi:LOW QUALITY PROTEIN: CMRF35-like molecule 8 [Chionomys nivalis]|uniref:LOW QUALITY PROTEIN: CMRF35-like molecule 8 n=1 Tax=Chionomys nivalis TaxID=269649 RepID=UPI002591ADDC|nr:LOW QUALITY PROTEIN: CMRF35-like molecule 8 [Chionomys nivalis]
MPQLASAVWLPKLLLLLLFWLPGCVPLRGPSTVKGAVGESLSVQCQYEEKYKSNAKYWCRGSLLLCTRIVKTRPGKEARNGRVSIRDHPANLTFTVTLENLSLEDTGTYKCGVDVPFINGSLGIDHSSWKIDSSWGIDDSFKVEVSVVQLREPIPGTLPVPTSLATSLTTSLTTEGPTQGSVKEHHEHPRPPSLSLPVLLSVLALLLFLLVGTSLLAWRMFQKHQFKADKHLEVSQNLRQAAEQSESQYVNLQLHTLSLREEPAPPRQVEVEYSTVGFPQEELHYASMAFDSERQDSHTNRNSPRPPQNTEAEYSEVRKPREGLSDPHL